MKACSSCERPAPLEVQTGLCAPCLYGATPRRCARCGHDMPPGPVALCGGCLHAIARILSPSASTRTAIEPFAHTPRELDRGDLVERTLQRIFLATSALAALIPWPHIGALWVGTATLLGLARWARPRTPQGRLPPARAHGSWWRKVIAASPIRILPRKGGQRRLYRFVCGCAFTTDPDGNNIRDPHNCMFHP